MSQHATFINEQSLRIIPLHQEGIMSIEGPDAEKFLQGQVTCDIRELSNHISRHGAKCNSKGRMISSFRIISPQPGSLWLRTDRAALEALLLDLKKYIVFSKATLNDRSDQFQVYGIVGKNGADFVASLTGQALAINDWLFADDIYYLRLSEHRIECWIPNEATAQWQAAALQQATLGSVNDWSLAAIAEGRANVVKETIEIFTPQALNYQLTDSISFKKGCYTGQEIVARLHYRANLKRHLYRVGFAWQENTPLPSVGSFVINEAGKHIGEIAAIARANHEQAEALVNLPDDQINNALIGDTERAPLHVLPLPYKIEPHHE